MADALQALGIPLDALKWHLSVVGFHFALTAASDAGSALGHCCFLSLPDDLINSRLATKESLTKLFRERDRVEHLLNLLQGVQKDLQRGRSE